MTIQLDETIKRFQREVGGVKITRVKRGRKDPRLSAERRREARRHRSSRARAARKYHRSMKGRKVRRIVQRVRKQQGTYRQRRVSRSVAASIAPTGCAGCRLDGSL